jgi:hypothetical protein
LESLCGVVRTTQATGQSSFGFCRVRKSFAVKGKNDNGCTRSTDNPSDLDGFLFSLENGERVAIFEIKSAEYDKKWRHSCHLQTALFIKQSADGKQKSSRLGGLASF